MKEINTCWNAEKITVLDMNNTQRKSYNKLIHGIYKHAFLDDKNEYEFKKIEISKFNHSDSIYVYAIVGSKNESGTLKEILSRDTFLVAIGKNGGWTLVNTGKYVKNDKVFAKTLATGNNIFCSARI